MTMAPVPDTDRHKFNDDLLANEGDLEKLARRSYRALFHVLDHPELRKLFANYDGRANSARTRSRRSGLGAIVLGTVALLGASAEPVYHHMAVPSKVIGIVSSIGGIFSVAIGLGGVLYAKSKRAWLRRRLMTERLRQFHFQTFVCHLAEIVASIGESGDIQAYQDMRSRWFDSFLARYEGHLDAELARIIDGSGETDVWLHQPTVTEPAVFQADLSEVFAAYKALRFTHQIQYANYKLRSEGKLLSASPRMQEAFFSQAAFVCVLLLFGIHVLVAFSLSVPALGSWTAFSAHNPAIHVLGIWCAILAHLSQLEGPTGLQGA